MDRIRNFSIIAHIDHGKSTLADRMLEITGTISKREMRDQVLDSMEIERERGITIKMQPVRMVYHSSGRELMEDLVLNLIDTPGHIDFSYEVSRALKAVEGSILMVDATQGVEAQTLTTLKQATEAELKIIPVLSKIDSALARVNEVREEVVKLLGVERNEIILVSGKTGEGVPELLQTIVEEIPPPTRGSGDDFFHALVFDFKYSDHRGVVLFVRVFGGEVRRGDKLKFMATSKTFQVLEVGFFAPAERATDRLGSGEIGYIVTGIKEPGVASVGDTVASVSYRGTPLSGYEKVRPVVWASIYPESQSARQISGGEAGGDNFTSLKQALMRLRLIDSALSFEEETSGILGRGFRAGFLGMLHLEIITERLRREFGQRIITTTPSISYKVKYKSGQTETIYSPPHFPEENQIESVTEPWLLATVLIPPQYIGSLINLLHEHEAEIIETDTMEGRTAISFNMPLRELMREFFDKLKSVTSGFGSISYELNGEREANVTRLDIVVADEPIPAFARVISRRQVEVEAERSVEKLSAILPRQMFSLKIQAKALGRIISSRTLSGMRKDVTQHMYGGDITRKMKLREKQKKGKKKMKELGKVSIPPEVFMKMMKRGPS